MSVLGRCKSTRRDILQIGYHLSSKAKMLQTFHRAYKHIETESTAFSDTENLGVINYERKSKSNESCSERTSGATHLD